MESHESLGPRGGHRIVNLDPGVVAVRIAAEGRPLQHSAGIGHGWQVFDPENLDPNSVSPLASN